MAHKVTKTQRILLGLFFVSLCLCAPFPLTSQKAVKNIHFLLLSFPLQLLTMTCKNCGHHNEGAFCASCGQKLHVERIKLSSVLHDVIHNYTHFDKGFLYTLKELTLHPGTLQKKYLSGHRIKSQTPFTMFIACGTICALALYLIYKPSPDTAIDQYFYKHYYVLAQAILVPVYALSTWMLFASAKLYFAEMLTLILYMLGFMSLLIIPVNLLHFFLSNGTITLIEMILLAGYNVWTYINFFDSKPVSYVVLKSILNIVLNFALFQVVSNLIIKWFMHE